MRERERESERGRVSPSVPELCQPFKKKKSNNTAIERRERDNI